MSDGLRTYQWAALDADDQMYGEREYSSISNIPAKIVRLMLYNRHDPENAVFHHVAVIPKGAAPICLWTTPIVVNPNTGAQVILEAVICIGWERREDGDTSPAKGVDWTDNRERAVTWVFGDGSAITTTTQLDLSHLGDITI